MKCQSANGLRLRLSPVGSSVAAALGTALLAMSAQAQEIARLDQPPAFVDETVEVSATVMDIDPDRRIVALRTDEGDEFTVQAGEDVVNFDQIEVGDTVEAVYYEALAAEITTAPPGDDEEAELIDTGPAPVGDDDEPLGRAVGLVYTAVVTIDEVDTENNTVMFTGPRGEPREITVERPELQEFIGGLSEGDRVRVTYGEALAVSLTPTE